MRAAGALLLFVVVGCMEAEEASAADTLLAGIGGLVRCAAPNDCCQMPLQCCHIYGRLYCCENKVRKGYTRPCFRY